MGSTTPPEELDSSAQVLTALRARIKPARFWPWPVTTAAAREVVPVAAHVPEGRTTRFQDPRPGFALLAKICPAKWQLANHTKRASDLATNYYCLSISVRGCLPQGRVQGAQPQQPRSLQAPRDITKCEIAANSAANVLETKTTGFLTQRQHAYPSRYRLYRRILVTTGHTGNAYHLELPQLVPACLHSLRGSTCQRDRVIW